MRDWRLFVSISRRYTSLVEEMMPLLKLNRHTLPAFKFLRQTRGAAVQELRKLHLQLYQAIWVGSAAFVPPC